MTAEHERLRQSPGSDGAWRRWGPYVSGRQWGTVREDYSDDGDAWAYFPFDQAHRRAYRWGEDGLAGLCDRDGLLNLTVALWNGQDDRLKERCFGLTNGQGNHGEDVKEYWWALDATPSHSWARWLYRYPQAAFPYAQLVAENARRTRHDPEFELADTGVLEGNRFFDVSVTHAKAGPDDICVEITATNQGQQPAPLHLLPQLWFRNTWSWGRDDRRPSIRPIDAPAGQRAVSAEHPQLGRHVLVAEGEPTLLLCDNETDTAAVFGAVEHVPAHPKDAVDKAVVHGDPSGLYGDGGGEGRGPAATKVALWWRFDSVPAGGSVTVRLRLTRCQTGPPGPTGPAEGGPAEGGPTEGGPADSGPAEGGPAEGGPAEPLGPGFAEVLAVRAREADEFYAAVVPSGTSGERALVARRAFAGLLWGKQLYRYDVREWLEGDPGQPPPPAARRAPQPAGRNTSWTNLALADVMSMPDEWEYPWFASWDLAFHCVALAHVDPDFAKEQLLLICREWAMRADGQLPAYEWSFSDVNPPVQAWAVWQVYCLDGRQDRPFLVRAITKLLLNFGWWVNREDPDGSHLFSGGFLGMDNIGPFDRSAPLPDGASLEQSDATSWMAFCCLCMLQIAWELAREEPAWDSVATTFLEHFLAIAEAMESFGSGQVSLWDEQDGFYYDAIVHPDGSAHQVRVRSMVGLLPLLAVAVEPEWVPRRLPDFSNRLRVLQQRRPDLTDALVHTHLGSRETRTLSVLSAERLHRLLAWLLDQQEFLSPHGIRSLSAAYRDGIEVDVEGSALPMRYVPAESDTGLFGGNSNWRGPVWFPVNVLLADALRTYAAGLAESLTVEFPTGSGRHRGLAQVAEELEGRLVGLFLPGEDGRRPGAPRDHPTGELWDAHPTFSEYFDGDTGMGLGASHQTGWTALVAHLICTTPGASGPGAGAD